MCSVPGCGELEPCSVHSFAVNAWSPWRSREAQRELRGWLYRYRWRGVCERCGRAVPWSWVDVHHVGGSRAMDGSGVLLLCNACHCAVDRHARRRRM